MRRLAASLALAPIALLVACGGAPATPAAPAPAALAPAAAAPLKVAIEPKSGSKLAGTATFEAVPSGVKVRLELSGATPGKLASHVHEKGDCSDPEAKNAGGHFNPGGHSHGLPGGEHHLGDLGNVEVKSDGTAVHEVIAAGASLVPGDASSFLGKAIIVHEKADDGGQPTGNAGARIGCGVIGVK